MMKVLAVMVGCACGGALRFWLTSWLSRGGGLPVGTLAVNGLGCFLIGLIFTILTERFDSLPEYAYLLLITGFLGGLTTFSSFGNETVLLWRAHQYGLALLYVLLSNAGGLAAVWLGSVTARFLNG
jgi:protein CrcB